MKVDKAEFDTLMASNSADTLGFCFMMQTGNSEGEGQTTTQCFIVDEDPIKEMGRMVGNMISQLSASGKIDKDEAGKIHILWRKIIKS